MYQNLKVEYEKLREEHSILIGHHNNKQKIHYVLSLKRQVVELMEENTLLKAGKEKDVNTSFAHSKASSRMKM